MAYEPLGGSPPNATTPVLHAPQQVAQVYSMHVEEEKSYGDAGVALPVVQQLALQATGIRYEMLDEQPVYDGDEAPSGSSGCSMLSWLTDRLFIPVPLAVVYFCLTFTQELPTTAISLILVHILRLEPDQIPLYYAAVFLPWSFKPLYALVSDLFPILRYRRRPYLVLCNVLMAVFYVLMALYGRSRGAVVFFSVAISCCSAFSEVVADSIAVEIGNRTLKVDDDSDNIAQVQASCMFMRSVASLFAAALSILLLRFLSPLQVLATTALCPLVTVVAAIALQETRVPQDVILRQLALFCDRTVLLRRMRWYWLLIRLLYVSMFFVFLANAVPSAIDAYSYYLIDAFDSFSAWEISLFKFIGLLGSLGGTLLYGFFCTNRPLRGVFVVCSLLAASTATTKIILTQHVNRKLHLGDAVFVGLDKFVSSCFGRMALMPGIVLAAQSCPPGIEALVFSLFSAAAHFASLLSSLISSRMTSGLGISEGHYEHLWLLIVICNVLLLVPLLILPWLPDQPLIRRLIALCGGLQACDSEGRRDSGKARDQGRGVRVVTSTRCGYQMERQTAVSAELSNVPLRANSLYGTSQRSSESCSGTFVD